MPNNFTPIPEGGKPVLPAPSRSAARAAPTSASGGGAGSCSLAPFGNTGRKSPPPVESVAFVDWLAFSFLWSSDEPYPVSSDPRVTKAGLRWLLDQISSLLDIHQVEPLSGGKFGYLRRYALGVSGELGTVLFGGDSQRRTVSVQLTGQGCKGLDMATIADRLDAAGAWITRVDLAHDDLDGSDLSVSCVRALYDAGEFTTGGRPPKARLVDDLGTGSGCTFYVGSRGAGKMLRVYEKGRQLGDPHSPWVRAEVELRNSNRIVPTDCLRRPADFLAATYPPLAFLSKRQDRIETFRREAEISCERMLSWLRHAAGKSIYAAIELHDGDIGAAFDRISRVGWPPRVRSYMTKAGAMRDAA